MRGVEHMMTIDRFLCVLLESRQYHLDWRMRWETDKYACAHDKHTVNVRIVTPVTVVMGSKHYD